MNRVSRAIQHGAVALQRRLTAAPVGVLAGLAVVLVGGALAALATAPGHELARRVALGMLRRSVNGTVSVGSLGGTLWRAASLEDVELAGADGRTVIRAARVRARYALADLARGRLIASRLELVRPVVVLEQAEDGSWNMARLFRSRGGPTSGRRGLIELRGIRIVDGALTVRRRTAAGGVDEKRLLGLNAELSRLRVSHPDSAGMAVAVSDLSAFLVEPELELVRARGAATLHGDSLRFDFDRVDLPGTRAAVAGRVRWGGGATSAEVAVRADRVSFADLAALGGRVPRDGGGRIAALVRVPPGGGAVVDVRESEIETGESSVAGRARISVGPGGGIALSDLDVRLEPLDLALIGVVTGREVPRGLVRGRVEGSGTPADLSVNLRVAFTDREAPGHPVNVVEGRGRLTLGGAEQLAFRGFVLRGASVDFLTIRRFAPAVAMDGRLGLDGRLEGPWRQASYQGALSYTLPPYPTSRLEGRLMLVLRDTFRVEADVRAEALSLDQLAASWPAVLARGVMAGPVRISGPLSALGFSAELSGGAGWLAASGVVSAGDSAVRLVAAGSAAELDLATQRPRLPATALNGEWSVDFSFPTGPAAGSARGAVRVGLSRGRFAGAELLGGAVALEVGEDRIAVDTGQVAWRGGSAQVFGALGRAGRPPAQLSVAARADTLSMLLPVAEWLAAAAGDTGEVRLGGAGQLSGRLVGTTAAWEWTGSLEAAEAAALGVRVLDLRAEGGVGSGPAGWRLAVEAALDSLSVGGLEYGPVGLGLFGAADSLRLSASAGFDPGAALSARLTLAGDSLEGRILLDSLRLELPSGSWRLAGPAAIRLSRDSAWTDSLVLRSETGWIRAAGSLPRAGVGEFQLSADSVPLGDLYALAQRDTAGVGGLADFSVRLAGAASSPAIEARAGLQGGRFGEFRAPRLDALASYSDRRLSIKGGLWREGTRVVAFNGRLPIDLSLSPVPRRLLSDSLLLSARSDSVDLAVVDALTELVRDVGGSVDGEVRVEGTWTEPRLAGYVEIHRGAVSIPALGARYAGIESRLDLDGDRITLSRARLVSGGTLDLSGHVTLAPRGGRAAVDRTLDARGFDAFELRDFAGVTGTGRLRLTGPVIGAALTGGVTVDAGFLAFRDLVEKRVVSLDDPEFQAIVDSNLARAAGLGPEFQLVFLDSLRIDSLAVTMGPDVWLRSHEANIQLAGEFRVAKGPEGGLVRYRMDGTLRAARGTYRLELVPVSREFRVARGTVRFFGTPDLNPELDIAAEHQVRTLAGGQLVVRAIIGGTLLEPKLSLESDQRPPLSETDIVSYLLFGRPAAELAGGPSGTRNDAAILANAFANVAAGQLEQTLVADLGVPLDYLAIRPGAGTDGVDVGSILTGSRVEAGKQLSERTFVTLNAGLCEVRRGATSQLLGATIEYRLSRRLTFEASVEPLVRECRELGPNAPQYSRYQLGFDLSWLLGVP